jgi:hypothetical protein
MFLTQYKYVSTMSLRINLIMKDLFGNIITSDIFDRLQGYWFEIPF